MVDDLELDISYSKIFKVKSSDCAKSIPMDQLTVRSRNCLTREGLYTYEQLFQLTPNELRKIRNLGAKSVAEIEKMLSLYSEEFCNTVNSSRTDYASLISYIKDKNYSFIDNPGDLDKGLITAYIKIEECWGRDYIQNLVANDDGTKNSLGKATHLLEKLSFIEQLDSVLNNVPVLRKQSKASTLLDLFNKINPTDATEARKVLFSEDDSLSAYCEKVQTVSNDKAIIRFVEWCAFNIGEMADSFCQRVNEKRMAVVRALSDGSTLEAVGEKFGVTRERIRQMKVRVASDFSEWSKTHPLMGMISSELGNPRVLKVNDIERVIGSNYSDILIYLLKQDAYDLYAFNKDMDAFVLNWDPEKGKDIAILIKTLPKYYSKEEYEEFIHNHSGIYDAYVLRQYMNSSFEYKNGYYFKEKLSISDRCEIILNEYYPNGLHVYSNSEIETFSNHYLELFGEKPTSKRSLISRIIGVGILCDRGTYKLKDTSNISDEIIEKIDSYIQSVSQPIFVVEDLFEQFKDVLFQVGVSNKYYLQAILQDKLSEKYRTKRNFLFKDPHAISIYDEVAGYIESSTHPVTISDIRNAIVGVNNIYISWAIAADSNILNLFGAYYYASHIDLSDYEISTLRSIIDDVLLDNGIHHIKDVYEVCESIVPYALKRNYIKYPFSLQSLLMHLFEGEYQFVRPFIAPIGTLIENSKEMVRGSIYEYDEISIESIREIARELHYSIYSLTEFIDECNDKYLIADRESLIDINKTGINESVVASLESLINEELNGTVLIRELKCIHNLPHIDIPWTEWLIYSVIKKWSTKFDVGTTNSRFRQALPLIAYAGEMDTSSVQDTASEYNLYEEPDVFSDIDFDLLLAKEAEEALKNEL